MSREGKARVLTLAEFKRAEKAAMLMRHALRNRALLYISFSLALRAGEIRNLKISDVLGPEGDIFEEINLLSAMTKGNKQRHVYITNKKTREVLKEYIDYLKQKAEKNKTPFCVKDPLFESQKGGPFYGSDLVRVFSKIFKLAGLPGAKSHSGRRTFITNRLDEGCDIRSIAIIVGHANIQTTVGYHEANPTRLKKIAEKSIF